MKKLFITLFILSIAVLFAFQKPSVPETQERFVVEMPTPIDETAVIDHHTELSAVKDLDIR